MAAYSLSPGSQPSSILRLAPRLAFLLALLTQLATIPSASAMNFVSRKDWKAQAPQESYTAISSPKGVKVHYLGSVFGGKEHSECDEQMRSVQSQHMSGEYFDIAYSLAVCQHGYVYDGRGKGHQSGANGDKKLNAEHYAVLAFAGKYGVSQPSQAQITGIQDAVAYLRRAGAGNEIKGHRDGYSTECPGEAIYKLVTGGTLDPGELWDGGEHEVEPGETLGDVSLKYNVPRRYIISANNLKEPYNLVVGDKLKIPARGVPLGEDGPGDSGNGGGGGGGGGKDDGKDDGKNGGGKFIKFPGAKWFKDEPYSPGVTAMGKRLVAVGCNEYREGPGPQWTDADKDAYKCWQEKLGFVGADADGWPGKISWDKLKVPRVGKQKSA